MTSLGLLAEDRRLREAGEEREVAYPRREIEVDAVRERDAEIDGDRKRDGFEV